MTRKKALSWMTRYCLSAGALSIIGLWAASTALVASATSVDTVSQPSQEPATLAQGQILLTGEAGQYTGKFLVNSSLETAWAVLTDYDNFEQFLPFLKDSQVIETHGDRNVVEQNSQLEVLFFSLPSQSRIATTETYLKNIAVEGLEGDWKSLSGTWQLELVTSAIDNSSEQVLITHHVMVEPGPTFSRALFFRVYKAILEDTLTALKQEMEKRSG